MNEREILEIGKEVDLIIIRIGKDPYIYFEEINGIPELHINGPVIFLKQANVGKCDIYQELCPDNLLFSAIFATPDKAIIGQVIFEAGFYCNA